MAVTEQELIDEHEYILEDFHEGVIVLDNVLKLFRVQDELKISRSQLINIAFFVGARVGRDVDNLNQVKQHLPSDAANQFAQLSQRFDKQHKRVIELKLLGYDRKA